MIKMEEMVSITVNADTVTDYVGDYRDAVLKNDGDGTMVNVEFPRRIVEQFCMERHGWTFNDLIENEYDCTDTDGLYEFAIEHGFHPHPPMPEVGTREFRYWFG